MDWRSHKTSIIVLVFALHVTAGLVFPIWAYFVAFSSSIILGIALGVWLFWIRHKDHVKRCVYSISTPPVNTSQFQRSITKESFKPRMLISRNADVILEEIVDNLLRDNVMSFYNIIVHDDKHSIQTKLKNELWVIISKFLTRIRSFDESFLEKDFVNLITKHVRTVNDCLNKKDKYVLYAHLKSEENEKIFIDRISDVLLDILAPRMYTSVPVLKNLLQQILTNHVIFRAISVLSDPDFINQTLLNYLSSIEQEAKKTRSTQYAYAETFDKFIDGIKATSDVEELKRMRHYIVTEIMQASAINHLKHQRGLDVNRDKRIKSSVKGDQLLGRNLPRYMNQLRFAKKICDKRIAILAPTEAIDSSNVRIPEKKVVFSFRSIMSCPESRKFLHSFLENTIAVKGSGIEQSAHHLFTFWESVNSMKLMERVKQIEVGHELITYTYFINSINGHTRIPKEVLKDMEQFILGNCGPEAFFQTQKVVYKILEDRYYPRFIVSKDYDEMVRLHRDTLEKISKETHSVLSPHKLDEQPEAVGRSSSTDEQNASPVHEHITLSEQSLLKLRESLSSKQDALTALSHSIGNSSQPPEMTQKIISKLGKEIDLIQDQMLMREAHVARSQLWLQFLGQWRAEIYSIQTEDVESVPATAIIVHPGSVSHDMRCDAWVIARGINEIIQLKRKLVKMKPSLSRIEIFRLKNENDLSLVKKAKESMNTFFDAVLTDPVCFSSEEVYLFFNPSPDSLRHPLSAIKNNKTGKQSSLPFASLFGFASDNSATTSRSTSDPGDEQDLTRFFEELEGRDQMKDDIAEPMYALLREVFDLEENVGWLRKSLIAFVQVSYGKTINRQIRETVSWLTGEAMIAFYLHTLKESWWPKDPVPETGPRTTLDKDKTYTLAKHKLLQNIPDFLVNLMGESSAKQGILKLFELAQNLKLNKQLLYGFVELFMFSFIPELKQFYLHNDYEVMFAAADNL